MNPGPIILGALLGIGGGVIVSLPCFALGWADTGTVGGQMVLITIGFAAQFAAGASAARLAARDGALNGGLSALLSFGVVAAVALAAGDDPSLFALGSGAVVALVLGTAAGVLVESRDR